MALAIGGAPHGVRVADAQVGILLNLARGPQNAVSVLVEALGQIGQAGVLREGGRVKDPHVRGICSWHLMTIYLESAHCSHNFLFGKFLSFEEPVKIKIKSYIAV